MQRFSEKAPAEAVVLEFNFALGLVTGETLTGVPTITVAPIWGTDVTCVGLILGAGGVDPSGTLVLVPVSGGIDQNDYAISASCATSNPAKVLAWSGILPIRVYPSISSP